MSFLLEWLKTFVVQEEEGQTLIEYALIIVLIAIVVIAALVVLGPTIAQVFTNINANLGGVAPTT